MAENAKALEKHGVNQHREAGHYNCNVLNGEGNNATYLTARIERDRPDILADMKAVIEIKFARQKSADITFFSLIFAHYNQHSVASC